jgi:hypothetical protein
MNGLNKLECYITIDCKSLPGHTCWLTGHIDKFKKIICCDYFPRIGFPRRTFATSSKKKMKMKLRNQPSLNKKDSGGGWSSGRTLAPHPNVRGSSPSGVGTGRNII